MEIHQAHGHVTIPGRDDAKVTLDLFDWPVDGDTLPRTWSAIIDSGPVLEAGTEGVLHLDTEPTTLGHPFVVIAGGNHVSQIRGHER
ncbi:hypothetical protein [Embleya sp. NBC_00896]|uniref:hypothetical protein n=1 Tax=Embleya sp. NBC_00896 TaxID=2975961 RepID=UPI0038649D3F|nr:hypothetical protein OG928_29465 [Embleya sp. NBC_00896]